MNLIENPADPVSFLNRRKKDIIHKFKRLGFSEEEAAGEFDWMVRFIQKLEPLRDSQSETDEFLEKHAEDFCHRGKNHRLTHLIRATENNDSYCYAYNTFVYWGNLCLSLNLKRKEVCGCETLIGFPDQKREDPEPDVVNLSLSQVALFHVWAGLCISLENCSLIARKYGFSSGNALYNRYCTYSSAAFRKATADLSRKQLKNKIKLFESVVDLLPVSSQQNARQELLHLQNRYDEDF
jgi:hypothetical protein